MKQAGRENKQVTLVRDKRFIDGELCQGNQEETRHKPVRQQPLQGYRDRLVTSSSNTRPYKRKAITPVERNETKNYRPYEGHGELTLRQENEKRETKVFNKNETVTNIVNTKNVYIITD